jgi:hypothetical protein
MANKPNFQRAPVPAPPPGTEFPNTGGLPLKQAQVTLTPWTRQMLESMGWKEGDPIPGNIGPMLTEAVKAMAQQPAGHPMGEAPPPGSRVQIGKVTNFEDLPPEHQQELKQAMREAQEMEQARHNSPRTRAERDVPDTLSPGVREAAVQARALELAAEANKPIEVVLTKGKGPDFRTKPVAPATPPPAAPRPERTFDDVVAGLPPHLQPRPGAQVAGMSGIAPFVSEGMPRPQTPPEPEPTPEPEPEPEHTHEDNAGGSLPLLHCPRCMLNLNVPFSIEPTQDDRLGFVATILGASRFHKTYRLMDNRILLTFRSMTAPEVDLVFRQLRLDQLSGEILGDADYFARLNMYRMVCMLDRIADGSGSVLSDVPPILEIPYDEPEYGQPKRTRLVPMVEWFNNEVCNTESLRRIVAQQHRIFQRLIEALEAQTAEPDFWKEIG